MREFGAGRQFGNQPSADPYEWFSWEATVERAKQKAKSTRGVYVILKSKITEYFFTDREEILKDEYIMARYTCVAEVYPSGSIYMRPSSLQST